MSQPALGIIKCPKCKKYFIAAIGTLSAYFSGGRERDEATRKTIEYWASGDRACPYCENIISAKEWKKNIIDLSSREKIKKEQGDLEYGATLPPGSSPFKPRKWDKEEKVKITLEMPRKRIVFTTDNKVAEIILDYEDFIWGYKQLHREDTQYQVLVEKIKEQLTELNEVHISTLAKELNIPLDSRFHQILYIFMGGGKIILYDIENKNYVDFYIVRNYGSQETPFKMEKYSEYKLPNGKIFLKEKESYKKSGGSQ